MQDGGLDALVNQPASAKNWLPGGYVKGGYPKDSWENDLQYVIPGREGRPFDLYSFGADGKLIQRNKLAIKWLLQAQPTVT